MKVFKVDNQAQSELCWVLFVSFKRFLLFIFYHMNLNYTLSIPAASLPSVFNDVIISLNWLNFIETTWNRLKSYETVNTREGSMYKIHVNELRGIDGHCCVTIKGRGRFQWQPGKKEMEIELSWRVERRQCWEAWRDGGGWHVKDTAEFKPSMPRVPGVGHASQPQFVFEGEC